MMFAWAPRVGVGEVHGADGIGGHLSLLRPISTRIQGSPDSPAVGAPGLAPPRRIRRSEGSSSISSRSPRSSSSPSWRTTWAAFSARFS